MRWNRSNAVGVAKASCAYCHGYGTRFVKNGREVPCNCALRAIFRACLARFRNCAESGAHLGTVSLEFCSGRNTRRIYSRKSEEYMADFCLVSRRALNEQEHRIFRYHFLLGADWKLCCRKLNMDRGNFFHAVYSIEQKLGRTFAELEPYPLYPLRDYFSGTIHRQALPLSA